MFFMVKVSRVGDRCTRHYDCSAPFSACLNSQCVCISGTIQQNSKCIAKQACPLGGYLFFENKLLCFKGKFPFSRSNSYMIVIGIPGRSCVRKANQHTVENFVDDADDCPFGQVKLGY